MKLLALVSGGKDSCYAIALCQQYGHEIIALGNLAPEPSLRRQDLDSWMFQTVGNTIVSSYAQCTGLPLLRAYTKGVALSNDMSYIQSTGDEVEDLYRLVHYAKEQFPDLDGVCSGAIASDYQRLRVESVCVRLGLVSIAPLWKCPQMELLDDMIVHEIKAVIIKVAAEGLIPNRHLGRSLLEMKDQLMRLRDTYGCNVCGEGGEYETLVLDAPLFKFGKIVIDQSEVLQEGTVVPIGILDIQSFHIEAKNQNNHPVLIDPIIVPSELTENTETTETAQNTKNENQESEPALTNQLEDVEITVSEAGPLYYFKLSLCPDVPYHRYPSEACLELQLKALKAHLSRNDVNTSISHIVFVQLFLRDMKTFSDVNAIYRRYLPMVDPPSRACLQLDLQHPCCLQIIAMKNCLPHWSRRVYHVQSLSSWAPCCIGPYSQATSMNITTFIAGQLGLDPMTMQLPHADWKWEVKNVLHHCQSIAVAIKGDMQRSAMKIAVYLSSEFVGQLTQLDRSALMEMMEHQWPLWHSTGTATNERADAAVDVYLKVPVMNVAIQPIVTFIVVPALPKNAKIEIQPIMINASNQAIDVPKTPPLKITDMMDDFCVISDHTSGGNGGTPSVHCLTVAARNPEICSILKSKIIHPSSGISFIQIQLSQNDDHPFIPSSETIQKFGRICGRCLCFCLNQCHQQMLSVSIWYNKSILNHQSCSSLMEYIKQELSNRFGGAVPWSCLPSEGVGMDLWLKGVIVLEVMTISDYK